MNLKKSLKSKRAQASLEYFILLAIITGLTILSLSTFFPNVKTALQGEDGFFQIAVERLVK